MYKRNEFTNYILAIQHCHTKEIMNAKERTNTLTKCTSKEGNYKQFK